MARYSFYIDGLNFYHALAERGGCAKYKWVNYYTLAETVLRHADDTLVSVKYFTTYARWRPGSFARHQDYIKVLRSAGVVDIHGRFMKNRAHCHNCGQGYTTHEEKQTDVNIGLHVLSDAMNDLFDTAVIVTADTDLIPAIAMVHRDAPDKEVGVLFPFRRYNDSLKKAADFVCKINEQTLLACQFPDKVQVGATVFERPQSWK